jgi:hypothetical protein
MKDSEYAELQLKASICPHQTRWPAEHLHWQLMHKCADDLRAAVSAAYSLMAEVQSDADLSKEGMQRQRHKIASQAINDLNGSKLLERVREAVGNQMQAWEKKAALVLQQPKDAPAAILHWEIRDKFSSLKDERSRLSFLERFGSDTQVASALSNGPAGLTNLSDAEQRMLQSRIEQHVPEEIIAARDATAKALAEVEAGHQRAQDLIGQHAGLHKSPDGTWTSPDAGSGNRSAAAKKSNLAVGDTTAANAEVA